MKLTIPIATLAVALGAFAQSNTVHIETPSGVQQCAPIQLTYSGGQAPYQIAAIPAGQTAAAPLVTITDSASGTAFTWKAVNLQGGTSITLRIRDANGVINFSSPITVQQSSDTSCLNGASSSSSSSGSGSGSSTSAGSSTSSSSSSLSSSPTPSSPSASSTPSSTPSAGSTGGSSSTGSPSATSGGSSASSTSPSSTSSGPSASNTNTGNSAVGLKTGAASGIIGVLLAYVLA